MVKCEKSKIPPRSLAVEKLKGKNGSYNKDDVIHQLATDFNRKCYICELLPISDPEVEHLLPHHKGKYIDRMFDWNNLFLSCHHCNGIKNKGKYEDNIINCCEVDPSEHIYCQYMDGTVEITALDSDSKSVMTAMLIDEVFNLQDSGTRVYASHERIRALQNEMLVFLGVLKKYKENPSIMLRRRLRVLLDRKTAFAAFKRDYVKQDKQLDGILL